MVKNQRNSCCHMGCPPMIGDSHFHRGYSLRSQKSKPLGNHGIISVGRSKGGANIAASIPGHLGVIFQVQQEPFFHQATKGLPCRTRASCFPTGKPSRDALPSNFEQILPCCVLVNTKRTLISPQSVVAWQTKRRRGLRPSARVGVVRAHRGSTPA